MWLTGKQISSIEERLKSNKTVRRTLPEGGRLFIDRQLPFLCLYRCTDTQFDAGMAKMPAGGPAYLCVANAKKRHKDISALLQSIAGIMTERFGAYLILEIWSGPAPEQEPNLPPQALFSIHTSKESDFSETTDCLKKCLNTVRTSKLAAQVHTVKQSRAAPAGLPPCLPGKDLFKSEVQWLGLEIAPIFINQDDSSLYPFLYRVIRRQVSRAMARTFFTFTRTHTTHHPPHFHTLGRRAVVKSVWAVDRLLAEIDSSFDLLQVVTPVNAEASWHTFRKSAFTKTPRFLYHPRPVDPGYMKRKLFSIPVSRVEDPALQQLFIDKQLEIDRKLTLLADLNTKAFKYGSLQLYGPVDANLSRLAREILELPHAKKQRIAKKKHLRASEFKELAERELGKYRALCPSFRGSVRVSDDMYAGLLVSKGELIVGEGITVASNRSKALLSHEVGTHLLTWSNGLAQPLKLLASGLPGYDEFQEGIAVLAEYLCGGLDIQRLCTLAGRVIAVEAMISNADFIEVFHLLTEKHGFSARSAYLITMRVFRGNGFVKDAIYLRGLVNVLQYLKDGGNLESCFGGKMNTFHIPVYEELLLRKVVKPPEVMPLYLNDTEAEEKLKKVVQGMKATDLLKNRK